MKIEEPRVVFENRKYGDVDPTRTKWVFCCLQHYSGIQHCFLADGIKRVDNRLSIKNRKVDND